MKYIYGPVRSRRLGNSLGLNIVPYKVCSLDCVYCQLKRTTEKTLKRRCYVPKKEILDELKLYFKNKPKDIKIDYVTFSGSGEPTLHSGLGNLIKEAKRLTQAKIAVITNSTLLMHRKVREDLLAADLVVPSLDAVTEQVFERIDRPPSGVGIDEVIKALIQFRQQFKGRIWLEIMLVAGLNDSTEYLKKIKGVVDLIAPDRVQVNAPVRPPAESWVKPPGATVKKRVLSIFGNDCDILF